MTSFIAALAKKNWVTMNLLAYNQTNQPNKTNKQKQM
jgi:hypothetical protein